MLFNDLKWLGKAPFAASEVKYFMRKAKMVKNSENRCFSRQIGTVIVDPLTKHIVSMGQNGPQHNMPSCDDPDYLHNVVWNSLTDAEKEQALAQCDSHSKKIQLAPQDRFVESFAHCGVCPRKIIGAASGTRLELCALCHHSEAAAITEAHRSVAGCWLFCYYGVPCVDCTKVIVDAKIAGVVAHEQEGLDYSPYSSRWLLEKAGVFLVLEKETWYASDCA